MDYIYASDPQKKRRIITCLFSEKFPRPTLRSPYRRAAEHPGRSTPPGYDRQSDAVERARATRSMLPAGSAEAVAGDRRMRGEVLRSGIRDGVCHTGRSVQRFSGRPKPRPERLGYRPGRGRKERDRRVRNRKPPRYSRSLKILIGCAPLVCEVQGQKYWTLLLYMKRQSSIRRVCTVADCSSTSISQ